MRTCSFSTTHALCQLILNSLAVAFVIHGGLNNYVTAPSDSSNDFDDLIYLEDQMTCQRESVLPDGGMRSGTHSMLFVNSWLLVCGGMTYIDGVMYIKRKFLTLLYRCSEKYLKFMFYNY